MSEIHSGPYLEALPGACSWRHDAFGQHLRCTDRAIPALPDDPTPRLCADHLIQHVHTVRPWRRWFGDPT